MRTNTIYTAHFVVTINICGVQKVLEELSVRLTAEVGVGFSVDTRSLLLPQVRLLFSSYFTH